jgi:hypothetical protein
MNTSDNKTRVIEYGWINVFRNLLGWRIDRRIFPQEASNNNLGTSQKKVKLKTISGVDVPDQSTFHGSLDDHATTSDGKKSRNPKNHAVATLDVGNLPTDFIHQNTAKRLVSQMIYHINDKEQYLKYFKSLVAYEEGRKNGNVPSKLELEKEFGLQYIPETSMQIKKHKSIGKRSMCKNTPSVSKTHCDVIYHVRKKETRIRRKVGSNKKNDKLGILLKKILDGIDCSNTKDTLYENLIEELIELEESFME